MYWLNHNWHHHLLISNDKVIGDIEIGKNRLMAFVRWNNQKRGVGSFQSVKEARTAIEQTLKRLSK